MILGSTTVVGTSCNSFLVPISDDAIRSSAAISPGMRGRVFRVLTKPRRLNHVYPQSFAPSCRRPPVESLGVPKIGIYSINWDTPRNGKLPVAIRVFSVLRKLQRLYHVICRSSNNNHKSNTRHTLWIGRLWNSQNHTSPYCSAMVGKSHQQEATHRRPSRSLQDAGSSALETLTNVGVYAFLATTGIPKTRRNKSPTKLLKALRQS